MGILYQASDPTVWAIWLFVLFALMAFTFPFLANKKIIAKTQT